MTLNGAIRQLVQMRDSEYMPTMFKPLFDKVIETISECEEPTQTNAEATQKCVGTTQDCVSRQAAIDAVIKRDANCGIDSAEVLKALPSAQPQWIPCSERQPTENGEYIITVEDGEGMFTTSLDWRQDWKEWGFLSYYGESDEPAWRRVTNVVAWMPLPEPYKEEQE